MEELGSAKWSTWEGLNKEKVFYSGIGAVFGSTKEGGVAVEPPERHFLSVAPTRSGKGVSLIIPNLLFYQGSAIVVDPKGENAWVTAKCRRELLGQKTIILDPWGEVNRRYGEKVGELETASRFNPLSILDPENENYADDLAYIADALIINQGKEPHWDDSARELVAGLISFVVETMPQDASLPLVRVMLSKPYEEISEIAKEAQKLGFESVAARKLGRFALDSKEVASIVSTALTQTAFLDSSTLGENLLTSDFSFSDLVEEKATIYLVLPVDKLQTYGRWLRLMISIGIRTVARNTKKLDKPVLFILDEFGTIGRLSAVAQAYGLMAGLQMRIWAFVQDLVQLKRDYPDEWETFVGNSQAITFFNVMDQFSAEYFSKMLGTETVIRQSQGSVERAAKDPNFKGLMSDQWFSRDLMQPAEVRKLAPHLGILINRFNPLIFIRFNYFEDPFFFIRARNNPYFPDPKENLLLLLKEKVNQGDFNACIKYLQNLGYTINKKSGLLSLSYEVTGPENHYKLNENQLINIAKRLL